MKVTFFSFNCLRNIFHKVSYYIFTIFMVFSILALKIFKKQIFNKSIMTIIIIINFEKQLIKFAIIFSFNHRPLFFFIFYSTSSSPNKSMPEVSFNITVRSTEAELEVIYRTCASSSWKNLILICCWIFQI